MERPTSNSNSPLDSFRRFWRFVRESLSGKAYDFTSGNLHRAIFLLAVPMMLEMAMESVFAVVDIYFVAALGDDAVAAVGLTESVLTLLYALAIGLAMSTTATVARRIGEGRIKAANEAMVQAITLGIVISAVIATLGITFRASILRTTPRATCRKPTPRVR